MKSQTHLAYVCGQFGKICSILSVVFITFICTTSLAFSSEQVPDKTTEPSKPSIKVKANDWIVKIDNSPMQKDYIYVAIKNVGDHWEIDSISNNIIKPLKSSGLEVFAASYNLRYWRNLFTDMISGCDEIKITTYSVCSSVLADKKTGAALLGIFFGGTGDIKTGYINTKVEEAINSIPLEHAMDKLKEYKSNEAIELNLKKQKQAELDAKKAELEAKKIADAKKEEEYRKQMRTDARIGTRDWCEQIVIDYGVGLEIDMNPTYKCFSFGVVNEDILRNEGWTITNKQEKKASDDPRYSRLVHKVFNISIEKIR